MGGVMIDKRIGNRFKQRREAMGLTQEELSEKTGLSINYISTIERGASFPRCQRLITLLNALETNADEIFCDVLDYCMDYKQARLSQELDLLPVKDQKRILKIVELMIQEAKIADDE